MHVPSWRNLPPVAAGASALLGGAFLGSSTCGGYLWHAQAIFGTLAILIVISFAVPPGYLRSRLRRAVFAFCVLALFPTAAAVAATVSYDPPSHSIREFVERFLEIANGDLNPC
jgi:uncharacterized membrane protein YccC